MKNGELDMAEKFVTNSQILKMDGICGRYAGVSAEKIKMLNTCKEEKKCVGKLLATHKRVLIFARFYISLTCYINVETGYGDYEMYFGEGYEPSEMKHCKVSDMMDGNLEGPTVIYIVI